MADVYTWVLSEIRAEFRLLIGLATIANMTDAECNKRINDYYVLYYPIDAKKQSFDGDFTQATKATDDGEYSIDEAYTKLMAPMFIDNDPIQFFQDYEYFRQRFPFLEQYVTAPTITIGTDTTKIATVAFSFKVQNYGYDKAAAETAFSGLSTVPQNKFGVFSLKIDKEGTITIYEADDNSTGYDSIARAIDGLASSDNDSAFLGIVTVKSTDAGGFVPGTSDLSDSAVTDTYTDGDPAHRGIPEGTFVGKGKLELGPKPDDIYQFKCSAERTRPAALASDATAPADPKDGRMIALGAAVLYLASKGETERINDLKGISMYCLDSVRAKKQIQMRGRVAEPNF